MSQRVETGPIYPRFTTHDYLQFIEDLNDRGKFPWVQSVKRIGDKDTPFKYQVVTKEKKVLRPCAIELTYEEATPSYPGNIQVDLPLMERTGEYGTLSSRARMFGDWWKGYSAALFGRKPRVRLWIAVVGGDLKTFVRGNIPTEGIMEEQIIEETVSTIQALCSIAPTVQERANKIFGKR